MTETFLFNIAGKVLGKLRFLALQEVWLASGMVSEQEKLNDTLSAIRAVLLDAEEKQATNHQIADWLRKIKDALYDADDVLDEFQYEALRTQVEDRGGITRKVRNFFSRSNPLAFRLKMGHRIKGIREKLDEIAAEKSKFHLTERLVDRPVVHGDGEMTHSFVRPSDVIGRDDDKENIVQLLMRLGDAENFSVIPIVGLGGLGKTTLAKLVYNDERVIGHFDLQSWVCVSEDFNFTKLTKEIIKSAATHESCNDLTIDQLKSCVRRTLANKKFLLVLDDVWNNDPTKWIELKHLLMDGSNGSKIIVTTRSKRIASFMGTINPYNLKGLPHEDCLSLFVKWAFNGGEVRHHPNLLEIGEDIVKKGGGVPLAIKTLGSLLYVKTDENDWMYVKNNEIWKLAQKEDDILPTLLRSYYALPSYLKQCFAFCSIFPKNYEFNSVELIQLWMATGLLPSNYKQELEDVGKLYINELLSIFFFEDVEERGFYSIFKMPVLIHDLALLVAQSECSNIDSYTQVISKRISHLSFFNNDFLEEGVRDLPDLDKVRTILFPISRVGLNSDSLLETFISRYRYLWVLDLSDSGFELLPNSIGNLKHLRYLDLSRNCTLKQLPDSVCKLRNLLTLVLLGCHELDGLPRGIRNLINLRSLFLTTKQMFLHDEELRFLISLRLLVIEECDNLKSLCEGMRHLTALRTLAIVGCGSLKSLPRSMKCLTALETLDISRCRKLNLMKLRGDFSGFGLSLRLVSIGQLQQSVVLPQWLQAVANTLQHMRIVDCPNLVALPEWLPRLESLQKLEIIDCPELVALPRGTTGIKELKIKNCPKLPRTFKQETDDDFFEVSLLQETSEVVEVIRPSGSSGKFVVSKWETDSTAKSSRSLEGGWWDLDLF